MRLNTITLWTRQVPEVWEELQASGIYRVKEEYIRMKNGSIADYYLSLYRWYTNEARKYIHIPQELEYPIWLSVSEEIMLQPIDRTIIMKLEVPEEYVLMCNMDAWGYVVNYWYVPLDEEDARQHAEELKKYGIDEEDELISTSKGNFYPLLKQKIQRSWGRVFTMPSTERNEVATIWEIKKEWVKEVRGCDQLQEKERFQSQDGNVIMWTAQTRKVMDVIEREGVSFVKKEYIKEKYGEVSWIFETAYDFFTGYFSDYVKKPEKAEYPVWLFRDPMWIGTAGKDSCIIKLKVPASEIIFFDREKWGEVLNLSGIGEGKQGRAWINDHILKSWKNIFDITETEDRNIQGAIWCIKKEWIVECHSQIE